MKTKNLTSQTKKKITKHNSTILTNHAKFIKMVTTKTHLHNLEIQLHKCITNLAIFNQKQKEHKGVSRKLNFITKIRFLKSRK